MRCYPVTLIGIVTGRRTSRPIKCPFAHQLSCWLGNPHTVPYLWSPVSEAQCPPIWDVRPLSQGNSFTASPCYVKVLPLSTSHQFCSTKVAPLFMNDLNPWWTPYRTILGAVTLHHRLRSGQTNKHSTVCWCIPRCSSTTHPFTSRQLWIASMLTLCIRRIFTKFTSAHGTKRQKQSRVWRESSLVRTRNAIAEYESSNNLPCSFTFLVFFAFCTLVYFAVHVSPILFLNKPPSFERCLIGVRVFAPRICGFTVCPECSSYVNFHFSNKDSHILPTYSVAVKIGKDFGPYNLVISSTRQECDS